ncbi:Beta-1,4-N-acetylgalactosaminyltransferase bre-4 [Amphibalanus amphitrite]|uniref:Beta-1,4-N-acetylgalactosaminyltransferase n=1 Tax=Amphibalanus amphitrite TaxID=1232801 RepID=A0A6A4WSS3_AMPAM|nr:beta-1,4-N-acetylgalactosaminyltransferase bre-4-like isoform X1 [Amphibalanus amphitrite]XP_043207212.1 beta-1,4-N-acetylgalactosaminyltransferase bre-4-like isoform X1 [Amphibalanus amphitrite]KAF0310556.1 Beta-1,4-N-acetylgalactosaminyltransferase bre-4 [Amphibalanus amphitrite]
MYSAALVVPRGRGRLLRYLVGCVAALLFVQCFLSLLSARRALPTSFFQFDSSAAVSPRLVLGLTNTTARPPSTGGGGGPRDPLLVKVMVDPGSKAPAPPAAAVTVNGTAANGTAALVNVTASSQRPPLPTATTPAGTSSPADGRQRCPPVPLKLVGPLAVPSSAPSWDQMEAEEPFRRLTDGGRYRPAECVSRHRVAIIVPYRDREEHLRMFLYHMHPVLQRQQLDYGIFIVEQDGSDMFNRASLLNAGAMEAIKQYDFQCFVFHDVDLLMEDDRNLYTCPQQPRHMSVAVDSMQYKLAYPQLFGGVSAMTRSQFELVNGFSNQYWGWGGEDDDMYNRLTYHKLHIARYPANIARYKMVKHKHGKVNPKRFDLLRRGKKRFTTDGLSSLKYQVKDIVLDKLYTRLLISLGRR